MKGYHSYMDRVRLSETAHARLIKNLAAGEKPARRKLPLIKYGAVAACLTLLCLGGWGIFRLSAPVGGEVNGPQLSHDAPPGVKDTDAPGEPLPTGTPVTPAYIPVNFEGGRELAASIAMPEGWFTVELTQEQITELLGGEPGLPDDLLWSDYDVTGSAVYDGTGALWRVGLRGVERADSQNSFEMTLRPGDIPEDCAVENTNATALNGATVNGSKGQYGLEDGDELGETRKITFMARHVGVALLVCNRDGARAELLASLTANCYAGAADADTPHAFSLAQLDRYAGKIPDWRSERVTLEQARSEEGLGAHVPLEIAIPHGFVFEWGYRELGQSRDWLGLSWRATDGSYDYIELKIYGVYEKADSDEEPIPAGELTAEAVRERMKYVDNDGGDRPGWRGRFAVAYADGVTVEYTLKGVTPEEACGMLGLPA